ncbi:F0F1 ATP synthase subunit B [Rhizobium sp. Root1220]|uniref:F0F1 ATP synthase subunit B n=1 Tax=Rhizobium sp. Root1220 TaxID=1736432 RepID=UPI0006FE835D|nr:F0F1 ATP synthase subunit B [Rhizobium sp. Root1220]KQV68216.1 ATP F0F1 synthase subunit B [Rhizobium sp. Root1220]
MEFALDATFFAFVGLVLFLALVVYLKVPGMMAKSLDHRADQIRNELAEAKRLREEAQHLLAEYQRKRKEAEADAANIVAAAEREARMLTDEARKKTEEFLVNRTAVSEQKIKQAEADAMKAVRSAAVDLAIAAAATVLQKTADTKVQSELFSNAVGQVKSRLN